MRYMNFQEQNMKHFSVCKMFSFNEIPIIMYMVPYKVFPHSLNEAIKTKMF